MHLRIISYSTEKACMTLQRKRCFLPLMIFVIASSLSGVHSNNRVTLVSRKIFIVLTAINRIPKMSYKSTFETSKVIVNMHMRCKTLVTPVPKIGPQCERVSIARLILRIDCLHPHISYIWKQVSQKKVAKHQH